MDGSAHFYNGKRDGPKDSHATNTHGAPSRNTWYMAWTKQARINSVTINKKREQQHQQKQLTNSAKVKLEQLSKKKAKKR